MQDNNTLSKDDSFCQKYFWANGQKVGLVSWKFDPLPAEMIGSNYKTRWVSW